MSAAPHTPNLQRSMPRPAAPTDFHFLTVGASARLVRNLWDRVAAGGGFRISHLVHPTYDRASWDSSVSPNPVYFVRDKLRTPVPAPDRVLLASLERGDVPTLHNMILSDRVVARLPYEDALGYATLLARRLQEVFKATRPAAVIGDFDALHSSLGLAVARHLGIPWLALSFSTIPHGQVACCANLSPASLVVLEPERRESLLERAAQVLENFERGTTRAPAYLPPRLLSPAFVLRQLPVQARILAQVLSRRATARHHRYSDYRNSYSVAGLFGEALRLRKNVWRLRGASLVKAPPPGRYVFFGLHVQPEASIDVAAHFFSNQMRVVELMARSLPPTHTLLVKLHKSDVPNYSREFLARLESFPGVQVVAPHASALDFIRGADLVFAIQGTIGLEAALLGRPVIMFGDSPIRVFPSVATIGRTIDLPQLVRAKLAAPPPSRAAIVEAFASYLAPFYPAAHNDWGIVPSEAQMAGFVHFFQLLVDRLARQEIDLCGRVGCV